MPVLFFDTSALVKRYGRETGSIWVTQILDPDAGHQVYLSRLTGTEVVAAITRRERGAECDRRMRS